MLKLETKNNFRGWGAQGRKAGEYFYSRNMKECQNGISPHWKLSIKNDKDDSELGSMQNIRWFSQGQHDEDDHVWGMDYYGNIFSSESGLYDWKLMYKTAVGSFEPHYNGLITDQKKRLLYMQSRYIGLYDTNALTNYDTGTISVTNGSNTITGSGTTWVAGHTGKRIKIEGSDKVFTFTYVSATSGTLDTTVDRSTASGLDYIIWVDCDDQKWDLGANYNYQKPSCLYEDWIVIGFKNKIALINSTDDSLNTSAFDLPDAFEINGVSQGRNGVLIGATFNNRGVAILWDAFSDRAIAPWIWFNEPIRAVIEAGDGNWIVVTTKRPYYCTGYSSKRILIDMADDKFHLYSIFYSIDPQGAVVQGGKLIFGGGQGTRNRSIYGIYILDLETGLLEVVDVSNSCQLGVDFSSIFLNAENQRIFLGFVSSTPLQRAICTLGEYTADNPAIYVDIFGQGSSNKIAEGIKLSLGINSKNYSRPNEMDFTVRVKIASMNKQLHGYGQKTGAGTDKDRIPIDGSGLSTYQNAEIGDEVTILEGANAGEIRHITQIDDINTANEVWHLDRVLPYVIEASANLLIQPFKDCGAFEFTGLTAGIPIEGLYFNCEGKAVGQKFLVKIVLEDMEVPIDIQEIAFIYNDLSLI